MGNTLRHLLRQNKLDAVQCADVQKLATAFTMTIEEVLTLTEESKQHQEDGKSQDRSYLESNLSAHLQKAIGDYIQGEKDEVTYMDCLWGELYGSINADLWAGVISEEQANYLRAKYLYEEQERACENAEGVER